MANAESSTRPSLWKGRSKAAAVPPDDFADLNLPITYRHLLSPPPGARDPLRVVALCDSDAFYAACEQRRLAADPARPLVVRQWDALIAVNYPARTYGISRMSKWRDAVKKCPELLVVHVATYKEGDAEPQYWDNPDTSTHKVSLDYYRRESAKIIAIFKEGLPEGEIEKASIDEAFIDFTNLVHTEILERFPHLKQLPPDAPHGLDTVLPPPPPISWQNLGNVVPIHSPPPADGGEQAAEVGDVDGDDAGPTWHDVALSIAAERMDKIRADVRTRLGYTTSAGIARNKFLAKLSASYKKYDSQNILRNAAIPNYLRPMPFQKIRFLGGKLGQALADQYDVSTVGDLLTISLEELQSKFGESSIWVYEVLRGIDRSDVKEKPTLTKSMMASKNLPQAITKASEGPPRLRILAAELALRLNDARSASPAVWPKTIMLHVKHGYDTSRSKQVPFPFTRNVTVDVIAGFADKLWKEFVGAGRDGAPPIKVTHIGLGFTGLEEGENGQKSIEGFFRSSSKPPSWGPSVYPKRKREPTPGGSAHEPETETEDTTSVATAPVAMRDAAASSDKDNGAYVCPRCHRRIDTEPAGVGDPSSEALARARLEHEDFHFAEDLAKDDGGGGLRPTSPRSRPAKRKKAGRPKKGEEGIAKFFTRT
ncbi:DNA/RNA polymerase [Auriscalpium vulgare]|uniref:DNA/RNA polymerase n=1 Tax=Auriscalpium vulgare TaxID=40419 RepID=A0ACB8S1M3_9AGAM|nr:DNA/RNA polymerase [Auriscalpium vulgare]